MKTARTRWFCYTVIVGSLPFACRLLVFLIGSKADWGFLFHEADFIFFGLVLHISNINVLEHHHTDDQNWKTIQNTISIFFIFIYAVMYTAVVLHELHGEIVDVISVKVFAVFLSVSSLWISSNVYNKVARD